MSSSPRARLTDTGLVHGDELEPVEREGMEPPLVDLDPRYFKLLTDFEARFPSGPPSLVRSERLVVRGDVVSR
jgi:hypothetical protein